MGKDNKGGGGSSSTTQTVTNMPPGYIADAQKGVINQITDLAQRPYPLYPGPRIADFTGDQNHAFYMTREAVGQGVPALADSMGVMREVASYQAPMVNSPTIANSPMVGIPVIGDVPTATAATIGGVPTATAATVSAAPTVASRDVTAGQLAGRDLSAYMNPFTQNVINNSLNDMSRQNTQLNRDANANAIAQGAYGGSRAALLEAENNRNLLDRSGSVAGQLNMANFTNAQGQAVNDINRTLNADQFNSTQDLTAQRSNQSTIAQQNALQAQLQNQIALQTQSLGSSQNIAQAQLANQVALQTQNLGAQRNLYGAQLDLQGQGMNQNAINDINARNAQINLNAQQMNQNAIQNGQGIRMAGANALAGLGMQQHNLALSDANALYHSGAIQQGMDQRNYDLGYQDFMNQYNWPNTQLQSIMGAITGSGQLGTQQSTPLYRNSTADAIGTAGSLLNLYRGASSAFGNGSGGSGGGWGNWLSGLGSSGGGGTVTQVMPAMTGASDFLGSGGEVAADAIEFV